MDVNAWILHGDFLVGNKIDVNCCMAFLWVTRWMSLLYCMVIFLVGNKMDYIAW